jgi:hypothetical protein
LGNTEFCYDPGTPVNLQEVQIPLPGERASMFISREALVANGIYPNATGSPMDTSNESLKPGTTSDIHSMYGDIPNSGIYTRNYEPHMDQSRQSESYSAPSFQNNLMYEDLPNLSLGNSMNSLPSRQSIHSSLNTSTTGYPIGQDQPAPFHQTDSHNSIQYTSTSLGGLYHPGGPGPPGHSMYHSSSRSSFTSSMGGSHASQLGNPMLNSMHYSSSSNSLSGQQSMNAPSDMAHLNEPTMGNNMGHSTHHHSSRRY